MNNIFTIYHSSIPRSNMYGTNYETNAAAFSAVELRKLPRLPLLP